MLVRGVGYNSARASAVETLADVLGRYIEEIGLRAREYAEVAGRTESNVLDVTAALSDMDVRLDHLAEFLDKSDELPFPKKTATAPAERKRKPPDVEAAEAAAAAVTPPESEARRPKHVPQFVPPFPNCHTYARTAAYADRVDAHHVLRRQRAKNQASVESTLVRLWKDTGKPFDRDYASAVSVSQQPRRSSPPIAAAAAAAAVAPAMSPPEPTPCPEPDPALMRHQRDLLSDVEADDSTAGEGRRGTKRMAEEMELTHLDGGGLDDTEKTKKTLKCDQILNLTHQAGMPSELFEVEQPQYAPSAFPPAVNAAAAAAAAAAGPPPPPPLAPQQFETGGMAPKVQAPQRPGIFF